MKKIILDTNVPTKASVSPECCKENELVMQKKCMEYIENLVNNKEIRLVLDADFEIFKEYRNNVSDKSKHLVLFFMGARGSRWLGFLGFLGLLGILGG